MVLLISILNEKRNELRDCWTSFPFNYCDRNVIGIRITLKNEKLAVSLIMTLNTQGSKELALCY